MFEKKEETKRQRGQLSLTIDKRIITRIKVQANEEILPVSRVVEKALVEYLTNHKKHRAF